jgi:hypothetical protein
MPTDARGISPARRGAGTPVRSRSRPRAAALAAWLLVAATWLVAPPAWSQESATPPGTFQGLDAEVRSLKQDMVDLNRDLFLLEEELLFPSNSQVAVFVSMDVGTFFALDSVTLMLDGKNVANYLYTQRELDALLRGGVQRLWIGNVRSGEHEWTAFLTGKGPNGRYYTRGATARLEKGPGAKYLELRISDQARSLQPEFIVTEWE